MFTREEPERSINLKSPVVPLIAVILLGIQLFFPYKGWVILLSGFGGMWIISTFWALSLKRGLHINRDMSFGWKQVGDHLRERVLLENNGWAPSLWVHVDDHSNMQDYEISSIIDVRSWRYRNWHTQGVCNNRGLFTLGPVTLESEDPFGIYQVRVDYTESVNMMVVPPVVKLPEIEIASGGRVGEGRSSNKGLKLTVSAVGVREYIPGDSMRWLHWPTIARMGEFYVHMFENEPTSDWWVLLDMEEQVQVGEGHCSTEEHGVILAASLVNRGLQFGKHVGMITHGEKLIWHPPDLGDAHLWSVLQSLAATRPGGPSLDQILEKIRSSLGRNSSLIIITPNLSPKWIEALGLLKRLGIIPTVFLMDSVSFGGSGNVDPVRNRLRKLEVTHHLITSDLLDRPQKRAKKEWDWLTSTQPMGVVWDEWDLRWQKAKRFIRTWGLIALFYYVFANMLDGAVRGLESDLIWNMIGGGLLVGGILAATRLNRWLVGLVGTLMGIVLAILRVGSLSTKVFNAFLHFFRSIPAFFSWVYQAADKPDYTPLFLRLNEIWMGASALGTRLWDWGTGFLQGQSYYDPVAITFLWSMAVWGIVVWSMWGIIRKQNPLSGFIPAIALVAITVAIIGKAAFDLVFMFGMTMALTVLIRHDVREGGWLTNQLRFPSGIRKNILVASITLTIGLMLFSLVTPSISIESITDFIRDLSAEKVEDDRRITRSLGLEDQSETQEIDILDSIRVGGLPNEHLIGSGSELSEQVVMVVQAESPQPEVLEPPLYIRSLVYDLYTGSGWESRGTEIRIYSPGEEILDTKPEHAIPVRQQIQFLENLGGFMYTVGVPRSADQDFRVAWRVIDNQNGIFDILGATIEGETYRADSYVQAHSVDQLRSAGQAYPGWVRDRYLTLPSTVPESVLTLALELTATQASPYDRAVAIEQYLRKIPYSLSVSRGPAGADIVEYFLFHLGKGYCDYYASSMVVLARAAGVPARYVVGYIGEFYDEAEGHYLITADQAHAWVEVFFPGFGWVPFEPTGGRPAIERPAQPFPELPEDFELERFPLVPEKDVPMGNWLWVAVILPVLVVFLVLIGLRISDWWLARERVEVLIPKLYKRIYRYARWAGLPVNPRDTAYHFAESLIIYLEQFGRDSYWADWVLVGVPMIREMTALFVNCLFNPHKFEVDAGEVIFLYKQLRRRLWLLWLYAKAYRYPIFRLFFWENTPLIIPILSEEE